MNPPSDVILTSRAESVGDGDGAADSVAAADGDVLPGGDDGAAGGEDGAVEAHPATSRQVRATEDGHRRRIDTRDLHDWALRWPRMLD